MKANNGKARACVFCAVVCLATMASVTHGQVPGIIEKKNGERMAGSIRYQRASKAYSITDQSGVSFKISARDVAEVRVKKPENLDAAIRQVQAGQYAEALPVLQEIASTYTMLEWDVIASTYLAQAHLQMGNSDLAIIACKDVIGQNKAAAWSGDLAPVYWQALLKEDRVDTLKDVLDEAVQEGGRDIAARAQVVRGDIQMKEGNFKDALLDGYLRTVVLFQNQKSVQPEALYKAAQCFDELGQAPQAEEMRKKLLADYPDDPYARKVQSGT